MPEPITRGIYVLAHDGKLKVGYSTRLSERLAAHRCGLRNYELLGFIPGDPEIDLAVRSQIPDRLPGRYSERRDWFPDTVGNRQLLSAMGLDRHDPAVMSLTNLAIDKDLHRKLKAIADKEGRRLRSVAERIIRAGIEAERKEPAHA